MDKKWNEMTQNEKKKFIAVCIYAAISLVFVVLDFTGVWKNVVYQYMLAAYFLFEGVMNLKKSPKMAALDIVLAVVWLLGAF